MITPAIPTVLMIGLTIAVSQTSPRGTAIEPQQPAAASVADAQRPAIFIESPAPDSTVGGPAIITFRTENVRITSVFAPESADARSLRGAHLHVKVDSAPWHWVHATADPVVVSALPPGTHTVRLELADKNHRPLDAKTVTFTIAAHPMHPMGTNRAAEAQTSPEQKPGWEFLVSTGAVVPTGAQRDAIKQGNLTAAQLSFVVRPEIAMLPQSELHPASRA
jgi:hypothetical protein